jgi:transaldolase
MTDNPLLKLQGFGQSVWLDFISRGLLASGGLERLIKEDGLRGVTSNPAIFEKAISGSHDYDGAIATMARAGRSDKQIYESLTVEDVQRAADFFRPVYSRTKRGDGFVSLEVSPKLAHDTDGTIAEARRLWGVLNRPNVLIKVPATAEGLPAIRELISEGINVNVTLLFGLPRYRQVAEAFIAGLEERVDHGKPVNQIASVASFFLSRIDAKLDPLLEKVIAAGGPSAKIASGLRGQIAIASAKMAYPIYKEVFRGARFRKLADAHARPQRLLWASTSTKNPEYSDVMYVEALIGPETVNTVPLETLEAYRDHGNPAPRLEADVDKAREVLAWLPHVGIDLDEITQQLEDEGVRKFVAPYESLMATLEDRCAEALGEMALHHAHER